MSRRSHRNRWKAKPAAPAPAAPSPTKLDLNNLFRGFEVAFQQQLQQATKQPFFSPVAPAGVRSVDISGHWYNQIAAGVDLDRAATDMDLHRYHWETDQQLRDRLNGILRPPFQLPKNVQTSWPPRILHRCEEQLRLLEVARVGGYFELAVGLDGAIRQPSLLIELAVKLVDGVEMRYDVPLRGSYAAVIVTPSWSRFLAADGLMLPSKP